MIRKVSTAAIRGLMLPACILLLSAAYMSAGEISIEETAVQLMKSYQNAILEVTAVVEIEVSGTGRAAQRSGEQPVTTTGTVIHENGMIVVAYSMINPVSLTPSMQVTQDGLQQRIQAVGLVKDVKIRMPDGREISGRLVLKDPDLDLAFILPLPNEGEEDLALAVVDLASSAVPALLEQLVMLGQMPNYLNRQPSVLLTRVTSMVERPRPFYAVSGLSGLGMPVFNRHGKVVGITVLRKGSAPAGQGSGNMTPVILPAVDVLEIAEQAVEEAAR